MNSLPLGYLLGFLAFLIICSAFFSSSETGLLSLNRYRLRHLQREGHKGAQHAGRLLNQPDRLLGTILVGNNVVNILAASIATLVAVDLWGDAGVAIATTGLTIILLIFGEITPKTFAALRPETVAFPASRLLAPDASASASRLANQLYQQRTAADSRHQPERTLTGYTVN